MSEKNEIQKFRSDRHLSARCSDSSFSLFEDRSLFANCCVSHAVRPKRKRDTEVRTEYTVTAPPILKKSTRSSHMSGGRRGCGEMPVNARICRLTRLRRAAGRGTERRARSRKGTGKSTCTARNQPPAIGAESRHPE